MVVARIWIRLGVGEPGEGAGERFLDDVVHIALATVAAFKPVTDLSLMGFDMFRIPLGLL